MMFTICSLVMLGVALALLPVLERHLGRHAIIAPAFLLMAIGLIWLSGIHGMAGMTVLVALVAAGFGLLVPLLAYQISLQSGRAQGGGLGRQTAAASLGDAMGSFLAGFFFDDIGVAVFWVAGGLMGVGLLASLMAGRKAGPPTQQHMERYPGQT